MRFMPTAHLIHGYLGAGKTTFARHLERDIPAIRFSHDEWMTRLYGDNPPVEHFADFYRRIYELTEEVWCRCLELGLDVVLDFGFWNRQERDDTRAKISTLGAQLRLYRLSCSEDEAWQRIVRRNADLQGSLVIDRNAFEGFKERFEPLDPDEARIEIAP
jgi:predicted kinase